MPLDSATWAALALLLTAAGGTYTFVAWRRYGAAAAVRGVAWTLVPLAAWLTGTLRLAGDVVDAVTGWAARLVFDPFTWLGIVLGGISVVLFGVSATMRRRGIGTRKDDRRPERKQVEAPRRDRAGAREKLVDDDVSAILKKHGIS